MTDYDRLSQILEKYGLKLTDGEMDTFTGRIRDDGKYLGDIKEIWAVIYSTTKVSIEFDRFKEFVKEPYIATLLAVAKHIGLFNIRKKFIQKAVDGKGQEGKEELHTLARMYLHITPESQDQSYDMSEISDDALRGIMDALNGKSKTHGGSPP